LEDVSWRCGHVTKLVANIRVYIRFRTLLVYPTAFSRGEPMSSRDRPSRAPALGVGTTKRGSQDGDRLEKRSVACDARRAIAVGAIRDGPTRSLPTSRRRSCRPSAMLGARIISGALPRRMPARSVRRLARYCQLRSPVMPRVGPSASNSHGFHRSPAGRNPCNPRRS
jgi:hypothetical protein